MELRVSAPPRQRGESEGGGGAHLGVGAVFFLVIATGIAWFVSNLARDLPNSDVLAKYEPPVMTRVHAADGELVAEYAHERRLYQPGAELRN